MPNLQVGCCIWKRTTDTTWGLKSMKCITAYVVYWSFDSSQQNNYWSTLPHPIVHTKVYKERKPLYKNEPMTTLWNLLFLIYVWNVTLFSLLHNNLEIQQSKILFKGEKVKAKTWSRELNQTRNEYNVSWDFITKEYSLYRLLILRKLSC